MVKEDFKDAKSVSDREAEKRLLDRTSYEPNSHKYKKEQSEKKVQKVISGNVSTRKKSLGKKFTETFFEESAEDVKRYLIFDVLIPAVKNTFSEMVTKGLDMFLFAGGSRSSRRDNKTYVSYSSYSSGRRDRDRLEKRKNLDFRDIIFDTRAEAEEVLSNLVDLTYDYEAASVADLYDLVGIDGNHTDNKYGWRNLSGAHVKMARGGGYMIVLPKATVID